MESSNAHLLTKGDVVQVDPSQEIFGGCFAQIDSVESWGVKARVLGPRNRHEPPATMHARFEWSVIGLVGRACWVAE